VSDYRPKPLVPLRSPQELKEATVRDYAMSMRRLGEEPNLSAIEKLAIADLTMVDAYRRGVDLSPKLPKRERRPVGQLVQPVADIGINFKEAPKHRDRPSVLYARAHRRSRKWSSAVARIGRILQGATPCRSLASMAATAQDPIRALEYLRLFANYELRGRMSRHNPFAGLSEVDAAKKFEAEVYRICDRSTGVLGHWWVK
jgi:hypothetical protein